MMFHEAKVDIQPACHISLFNWGRTRKAKSDKNNARKRKKMEANFPSLSFSPKKTPKKQINN